MEKNNLHVKFNLLAAFIAVIPVLAWGVVIKQSSIASDPRQFLLLAAAFVLYFLGLLVLVYLFRKTQVSSLFDLDQLRSELRQRTDEIDALKEISEMAHENPATDDLLKMTLYKVMQAVSVRNGSIFVVDPSEPEGLRFVAARPEIVMDPDDKKPRRHSFVKTVIETGQPLMVSDVERDPRTKKTNDPKYGSPAFISFPIYNHKKVLGVLNLANKARGGIFTQGDERLLSIVLGKVGFAMENASLRKTVTEQLTQIKDLSGRLRS
ncbi:MAG: GAF domain-containing protein [Smithellaceae bacterium]